MATIYSANIEDFKWFPQEKRLTIDASTMSSMPNRTITGMLGTTCIEIKGRTKTIMFRYQPAIHDGWCYFPCDDQGNFVEIVGDDLEGIHLALNL